MGSDFENFISMTRLKNGSVELHKKQTPCTQGNIYKLLRDKGFRISNWEKGSKYYRRTEGDIIPVTLSDIKNSFIEFIANDNLTNVPAGVSVDDILDWYYSALPIKRNGLFEHYLEDTLLNCEAHKLLFLTDREYRHKIEVKKLLSKFDEWKFTRTTDNIDSYSSNNPPLYYKSIGNGKYLIFNHWNLRSKNSEDGFDSWIATYKSEGQIGRKRPTHLHQVKLGFKLARDFSQIESLIN